MKRRCTATGWLPFLIAATLAVGSSAWAKDEPIRERDWAGIFEALEMPAEAEANLVHPILPVPVVVDGVQYEPEEIARFNGRQLHFVLDRFARQEGVIYAFTEPEYLKVYLEESERARLFFRLTCPPEDPCGGGGGGGGGGSCDNRCCEVSGYRSIAYFYQHHYFDGSWMSVAAGQSVQLCQTWWKDKISSVKTAGTWTVLYSGCVWSISDLWLEGSQDCDTLHSNFGWGDKAESIRVIE